LGCFVFGMFCSQEVLRLGTFCILDIFKLGHLVMGCFVFGRFVGVPHHALLEGKLVSR
jgi:hypothetical protein